MQFHLIILHMHLPLNNAGLNSAGGKKKHPPLMACCLLQHVHLYYCVRWHTRSQIHMKTFAAESSETPDSAASPVSSMHN